MLEVRDSRNHQEILWESSQNEKGHMSVLDALGNTPEKGGLAQSRILVLPSFHYHEGLWCCTWPVCFRLARRQTYREPAVQTFCATHVSAPTPGTIVPVGRARSKEGSHSVLTGPSISDMSIRQCNRLQGLAIGREDAEIPCPFGEGL
jgi:hypothetical protein